MNAFIVKLENKPGTLARVFEAVAARGINIESAGGSTWGDAGAVTILTNDEAGTRSALDGAGFTSREIEAVPVSIENRPGTLAEMTSKLAAAGVNIEALLPTGMSGGKVSVAFVTSDAVKARAAIGQEALATA